MGWGLRGFTSKYLFKCWHSDKNIQGQLGLLGLFELFNAPDHEYTLGLAIKVVGSIWRRGTLMATTRTRAVRQAQPSGFIPFMYDVGEINVIQPPRPRMNR